LWVIVVEGARAFKAASEKCAFFEWAVYEFNNLEYAGRIDDEWSLHGGFHEGHLREDESYLPFIIFTWHRTNGFESDAVWLPLIAEDGLFDEDSQRFI
jgi:hypothetical protein